MIGDDEEEKPTAWMVWTDGSSNQWAGGVGVLLWSPEGDTIECAICLKFLTIHNEANYEAILSSLNLAKAAGAESTVIHCDSQVVVGHINDKYEAKGEWMKEYLSMVRDKISERFSVKFVQTPREENE